MWRPTPTSTSSKDAIVRPSVTAPVSKPLPPPRGHALQAQQRGMGAVFGLGRLTPGLSPFLSVSLHPSPPAPPATTERRPPLPSSLPPNHNRQTEGPQRLGGGEALRGAQALARGAPAEGSPRACLGNRSPASLGLGIGSIARGRSPSSLQGPRLSLSPCSPSRSPLKMRKISGK